MAKISVHIEADNLNDLMTAMSGLGSPTTTAEPTRQRRTGKPSGEPAGSAPTPGTTTDAPTAGNGGSDDPDLMASPPPPVTPTATPQPAPPQAKYPTPDSFIEAVKKLLGKGKDDAVRAELKKLGYERVRDVPAEKYESTIDVLAKV